MEVEVVGMNQSGEKCGRKKAAQLQELGASMIEYSLLVSLICIVAIGAVRGVGERVFATFEKTSFELAAGADGVFEF